MKLYLPFKKSDFYISWGSILILIVGSLLLTTLIGYYVLKTVSFSQIDSSLTEVLTHVKNDLKYTNGFWDTTLYNSDPHTPYPNAPSSFPLYIITSDGFVIERSLPIRGFMDSSDFKHLINFQTPQTIQAPTHEEWRILSQPIHNKDKVIGVITVARFQPETQLLEDIDKSLKENIDLISSKITIHDNKINVTQFDIRNLSYDISFEIVDNFNKVILNHGRTVSFIDPSYISAQLNAAPTRTILDPDTQERFIVRSETLYDDQKRPIGFIATAKSITKIEQLMHSYIYILLPTIAVIALFLIISIYIITHKSEGYFEDYFVDEKNKPYTISFNKEIGIVQVNQEKIEIPIGSYQYNLCAALFSSPDKQWKQNNLLSQLNEEIIDENWRKVYDAYLAINKKVGFKLISYKNKMYGINEIYRKLIKK